MPKNLKLYPSELLARCFYGIAITVPLLVLPSLSNEKDDLAEFKIALSSQDKSINKNIFFNNNNSSEDKFLDLLADNVEGSKEKKVLISEVIIEGLEDHPNKNRLEIAAYDAMRIRPGSKITRQNVKFDLDSIYATGWFSNVRVESINAPLGVKLLVMVKANPELTSVKINPLSKTISKGVIDDIFRLDYGRTLNLNVLQSRMTELKKWYLDKGYSLVSVSGPSEISEDGIVEIKIEEGIVNDIQIEFLSEEGETTDIKGRKIRGKTRLWVIKRELSIKPGTVFNRRTLESDIKRLYGTSLFNDVKVSLKPVPGKPGEVIINLGISEQRTGSLTGGIGYSGGQGVFGQLGLQETNFLGRSWTTNSNVTYGEYGYLFNISITDPWIKGDKFRTSFRTNAYISREVPQQFRSDSGGNIKTVADFYEAPNTSTAYAIAYGNGSAGPFTSVDSAKASAATTSWFEYSGDSIVLEKSGGGFSIARPLNGGDPFKKVPWTVLFGMNFQKVRPVDYASNERPYGVSTEDYESNSAKNNEIICVAYNCANENTLVSARTGVTFNKLDNQSDPNEGDFVSLSSEQFVSLGPNSPTFNRSRIAYSHFIPVNFLKFHKGCRPKEGEKEDCSQTIGMQLKGGTIVGELPPYEAFCLGGSASIRGWSSCDLAVGRSYGEASAEYRFPLWRMISGSFFFDAGTDFGSQANVPGKPGELLNKPGSGFSIGSGALVKTPVGPLRLEVATKDFITDWRYSLGIGWKF